jgi:hypothetical protein
VLAYSVKTQTHYILIGPLTHWTSPLSHDPTMTVCQKAAIEYSIQENLWPVHLAFWVNNPDAPETLSFHTLEESWTSRVDLSRYEQFAFI